MNAQKTARFVQQMRLWRTPSAIAQYIFELPFDLRTATLKQVTLTASEQTELDKRLAAQRESHEQRHAKLAAGLIDHRPSQTATAEELADGFLLGLRDALRTFVAALDNYSTYYDGTHRVSAAFKAAFDGDAHSYLGYLDFDLDESMVPPMIGWLDSGVPLPVAQAAMRIVANKVATDNELREGIARYKAWEENGDR